ncbi:MAG: dienelactone hydrolase family protein [Chloroflexota bacterium]
MKWVKRILLGAVGVIGLAVLAIAGVVAFDSLFPAQTAADFTNVSYPGTDGRRLGAYLARPQGPGPFPAVLLVHEFYGINADIIKKADLLAQQGYLALAVDAYRGRTTRQIPRAIWLVITTPQDEIAADIDAGYAYLAALPEVQAQRIGSVGFCFGGTQVMHMAARRSELAATVIFYGSGPITDPGALGVMDQGGPVLGIYGAQDSSIPLDEVNGFELALQARGVPHRVTIYPGVGHAFVSTQTIAQPGAAQDAWQEMLDFLDETLNGS